MEVRSQVLHVTHNGWADVVGRVLLDDAPVGLAVLDDQLRHVEVNQRLCRMGGLPRDQILGHTPVELHGCSVAAAQQMYADVLHTGIAVSDMPFSAALPDDPDHVRHWLLHCQRLPGRSGVLILVQETTERVEAQAARDAALEELRQRALRDPLTGLMNRAGLRSWWEDAPGEQPFTVVFADLDGFKAVNDRSGHLIGDGVLVCTARAMAAALEPDEVIARVGGDEFVALTSGDGADLADRLRQAVLTVAAADPQTVHLSVSCGCARLDPGGDLYAAVHTADGEMYRSKSLRSDR